MHRTKAEIKKSGSGEAQAIRASASAAARSSITSGGSITIETATQTQNNREELHNCFMRIINTLINQKGAFLSVDVQHTFDADLQHCDDLIESIYLKPSAGMDENEFCKIIESLLLIIPSEIVEAHNRYMTNYSQLGLLNKLIQASQIYLPEHFSTMVEKLKLVRETQEDNSMRECLTNIIREANILRHIHPEYIVIIIVALESVEAEFLPQPAEAQASSVGRCIDILPILKGNFCYKKFLFGGLATLIGLAGIGFSMGYALPEIKSLPIFNAAIAVLSTCLAGAGIFLLYKSRETGLVAALSRFIVLNTGYRNPSHSRRSSTAELLASPPIDTRALKGGPH